MQNKNVVLLTGGVVLAVILTGGGFWLGRHHNKVQVVNDGAASATADTSLQSPASDGLSVSGSAANLGQLNTSSQSGTSGSGGTSSQNGNSSNTSPVDPATFAQYDKYKSNPSALFGDIQVGSGATLGINQKATITYKGWLTDGTLFDQSRTNSSGQIVPLSFTLGAHQVIAGMEEGVDSMKVGGSRLIIIPPTLGYGAAGQGSIPGNAVLVFEVSLLDVQ